MIAKKKTNSTGNTNNNKTKIPYIAGQKREGMPLVKRFDLRQ